MKENRLRIKQQIDNFINSHFENPCDGMKEILLPLVIDFITERIVEITHEITYDKNISSIYCDNIKINNKKSFNFKIDIKINDSYNIMEDDPCEIYDLSIEWLNKDIQYNTFEINLKEFLKDYKDILMIFGEGFRRRRESIKNEASIFGATPLLREGLKKMIHFKEITRTFKCKEDYSLYTNKLREYLSLYKIDLLAIAGKSEVNENWIVADYEISFDSSNLSKNMNSLEFDHAMKDSIPEKILEIILSVDEEYYNPIFFKN